MLSCFALYHGSLAKVSIFVKIDSGIQSQMEIRYGLIPHTPEKAQTSFGRKGCEVRGRTEMLHQGP